PPLSVRNRRSDRSRAEPNPPTRAGTVVTPSSSPRSRVSGRRVERPDYAGDVQHVEFLERPSLNEPPVICAFRGWNDGGEAANVAARYMIERWSARKVAVLDPEEFYDFQVSRPTVRLDEGASRVIEWPAGEFWAATVGGKDVVVFVAAEPNVRWK